MLLGIFNLQPEDYILRKLLLFTIMLVTLCFVPAQAADINSVKALIAKQAIEMGVEPAIALSIARTESGFNHNARSRHGAVGVFQLMPSTARRMGLNPYSLSDNIKGGIMYYKSMYKMFGSVELALAAYNAGPGNVKRYNKTVPPFAETKNFVSKIMKDYTYLKANPDNVIKSAKAASAQKAAAQKAAAQKAAAQKAEAQKAAALNKPVAVQHTVTTQKAVQAKVQPAPELIQVKEVAAKVEVVDETPVELEVEVKALTI